MNSKYFSAITVLAFAMLCCETRAQESPEGPTGTIQQRLVGGLLVDQQTQSDFGLLTLTTPGGTCSASMLNDSWAITAAHCVFASTTAASAAVTPNLITLSSTWPGAARTTQAVKVVPLSVFPFNTDIALVQTNSGVLALPDRRDVVLRNQRPMGNLTVVAFGRGISSLAFQVPGGASVPVVRDGLFRSAQFDIQGFDGSTPNIFSFAGKNGAVIAGGDSGGPSLFQDWDDPLSINRKLQWQLVGVHSRCSTTCLAGQSCTPPANPWTWVNSVSSCVDANVFQFRQTILDVIAEPGPTPGAGGTFPTGVPTEVLKHQRAMYAINIDEPLVAPPNAAVDIQLTFKMCHAVLQVGTQGCPLDPTFQIWGYDPDTHRLLHLPSGKCLNISGAHREPGAWIILFPCSGGGNEKWTVTFPPGRSVWTIKSDFSGLCLHAIPGTSGGGTGIGIKLPTPGRLTQMPCDGSTAQQFDDADANFPIRNGPH